jgi:hypothetical protein
MQISNGKWLFGMAYNSYIISGSLRLGHVISKVIDRGVCIELVGPYRFSNAMANAGRSAAELRHRCNHKLRSIHYSRSDLIYLPTYALLFYYEVVQLNPYFGVDRHSTGGESVEGSIDAITHTERRPLQMTE